MTDYVPTTWAPAEPNPIKNIFGRLLSFTAYPALLPFCLFSHGRATVENARWWRGAFTGLGIVLASASHTWAYRRFSTQSPWSLTSVLAHAGVFVAVDHPYIWLTFIADQLIEILGMDRSKNRLNKGELKGPRVLVVGNGPSALEGEPLGDKIDQFDEVVRFNNFQTKVAGMEKHVGTKTTVHFSDGVLYPTFKEYHVKGATVVLSLIMDRFMVAGTYFIMRGGPDLETSLTMKFLKDPMVTWITKADIERVKGLLGLTGVKHPTSGMLAIDYFLNKPGVKLPIYIHGFDFFMGPKVHYFDEHEPFYERINDRIGVNMHSPHKEKVYVEKLIAEGKVKFLKDM